MTFDSEFLLPLRNIKINYTELYSEFFLTKLSLCLLFCMVVHLGRSN